MEYRTLGRTGVKVSPLCLGAMNFGGVTNKSESIAIIRRAFDAGINLIDTANVYNAGESERVVGEALKEGGLRDRVVLATKAYAPMGEGPNERGLSRYHLLHACDESLRRLQTDHIDLYQLHRPSFEIPLDETLGALDDLVRAGKVRYLGVSTYPAFLIAEAIGLSERYGLARFVSEQPPYNLLDRRIENELVPACQRYGMAILPWSPLAGGILAGRYASGALPEGSRLARSSQAFRDRLTRKGLEVAERLAARAQARGLSAAQLALTWVKDQPGVTAPIIGPRTMAHLEEFLPVLEMTLTPEDRTYCDELVPPGSAVADFYNTSGWMKARILDPVE